MNARDHNSSGIQAQAEMHHAFLLGLQLMISSNRERSDVYDWVSRLNTLLKMTTKPG